jgi:hypothetical protein
MVSSGGVTRYDSICIVVIAKASSINEGSDWTVLKQGIFKLSSCGHTSIIGYIGTS